MRKITFFKLYKILRNFEFPIQVKNRINALVVGPGLSRNETIQDQVKTLLLNFDRNDIPIIFDGVIDYIFISFNIVGWYFFL